MFLHSKSCCVQNNMKRDVKLFPVTEILITWEEIVDVVNDVNTQINVGCQKLDMFDRTSREWMIVLNFILQIVTTQ